MNSTASITTSLRLLLLVALSFVCRTCLKEPLLMVVLFRTLETSIPISFLICRTLSSNSSFSGSCHHKECWKQLVAW